MSIKPLSKDEPRNEILTFKDGSRLEINAQMRGENPKVYAETCKLAVARKFPGVIDGKARIDWPAKDIQPAKK